MYPQAQSSSPLNLPISLRAPHNPQEGAVFKWVTGGNPAAAPWRIFGKEKNRLTPIGRMQHRPSNADLETVFYNGRHKGGDNRNAKDGSYNE